MLSIIVILLQAKMIITRRYHNIVLAIWTSVLLCGVLIIEYLQHRREMANPIPPNNPTESDISEIVLLPIVLLPLTVIIKLCLLIVIVMVHYYPQPIVRNIIITERTRRYGNFLFRRLVAQLEQVLQQLPDAKFLNIEANGNGDQEEYANVISNYRKVMEQAFKVIDIFRRDVDKIFFQLEYLQNISLNDAYVILPEDERSLRKLGYGKMNANVTYDFLMDLCYPKCKCEGEEQTNYLNLN